MSVRLKKCRFGRVYIVLEEWNWKSVRLRECRIGRV